MGLAPIFVEEIFHAIADLRRDGVTILLVEQNASAALEVADYAYVLETGRIVLQGQGRCAGERSGRHGGVSRRPLNART